MKYAEVNWIVIIIFAIGIISQIVEALKRKKGEGEEFPIPELIPDRTPTPAAPRQQQEGDIDDLLESLGLPRSSREEVPPPPPREEERVRKPIPMVVEKRVDPFSEGPRMEFPKESPREMYGSPFPTHPETLPATKRVERINFDEDLAGMATPSLNISASRFQVINARQGVGDIRKQLKTPAALRQAFILKEILDTPKGMTI